MGQKGYCCELLLALFLLQGATEIENAQSSLTVLPTATVTPLVSPTPTPLPDTTMMVTTDAATTMPPPVDVDREGEYPSEAIVILTITMDTNYGRDNISSLNETLLDFFRSYCDSGNGTNVSSNAMGSGDNVPCPVDESVTNATDVDYEVVYVDFDRIGNNTVELQFVVLTPEGVINVSASDNFIETLTDVFDESGLPIEVSLRPQISTVTTDAITVTTDEVETADGLPVGLIVGVVVGVGVPVIILVVVVIVIIVVIVVMKKKSKTAVSKITPAPSKSGPPMSSTTHGSTVPMEKFPKSDK